MLDAATVGLVRVNRGVDENRPDDLLTFMSNAILKSSKGIFEMRKPSKFYVPGWNERAKGVECSMQGGSEPLEYCWAAQKWSTCRAEM